MKHLLSILLTLLCIPMGASDLGKWTHFHAYNSLTHIVPTNNAVYALSSGRLFSYNPNDGSLAEYNTTNLLSDPNDITDICWNKATQNLIIAYSNGNIDFLSTKDNAVVNNASIANETTTRSKTIQAVLCHNRNAYIVMPYGVITVNTAKQEFGDTYRFTTTSSTYFTGAWVENDSLFLEANNTLTGYSSTVISGKLTDNLLDKSKWQNVSTTRTTQIKASIAAYKKSRLAAGGNRINDTYHNCYWGADDNSTLMQYAKADDGTYAQQWQKGVKPYGPASNNFFTIRWLHNRLYTVGRGWHPGVDLSEKGVIQVYEPNDGWRIFNTPTKEEISIDFLSTSDITVDPRDTSRVMVGARSGLYEFHAGNFTKRWSSANSPIQSIENKTSETYQMILGATYDSSGTLWALNSLCNNGLLRLDQTISSGNVENSTWKHMVHQELDGFSPHVRYLSNPVWDRKGNLWFINLHNYQAAFYCYNTTTDALTTYRPNYNQDGTTLYKDGDGSLRDINADAEGNIWLCGTKGVCYLPAGNIGTATNIVNQYKIARNDGTGLADYLLSTVDATCITFDSAGRKYIGTDGTGIYVISADNNTQLQHYDTSNSKIISDSIRCLAIDSNTGTLYCSTEKGLCSLRTDAITVPSSLDKNNIRVYPNPVPPDYSGMITFEGLTVDADIKITTATGAIVHTGRSTSALYQWDGCDQSGNRCASGIYNVLLATSDGSEGCVAKVAMVK